MMISNGNTQLTINIMYMRKILLFLFIVCASSIYAQTAAELIQKTEQACLKVRDAVAARSADDVMAGMEMLSEIPLSNLCLTSVDTKNTVPLEGHLLYKVDYLDSLLIKNLDMGLIKIEDASFMRKTSSLIKSAHRAVAAGKSITYSFFSQGEQHLLVVPECGGKINLYVDDKNNGRQLADKADNGKDCCRLDWTVERAGELLITIENKSNKDLSFIIVSN